MRYLFVPVLIMLSISSESSVKAQMFGLGLPSAQIQPARLQPISAPSVPSLQSLPSLGQSGRDTQYKPPTSASPSPDGMSAPPPIIGGAPFSTFGAPLDPKSPLPLIIDQQLAVSGQILVAAPIINAPAPDTHGPAPVVQTPMLANNALTALTLPVIGLDTNSPATLAPTSHALQVNAATSLAPAPVALQSDRARGLSLPILSLPVIDMMGRPAAPTQKRR